MRNVRLKNVWLVAKREYLERVKTKAFLILTLVTPALIVGLGLGPSAIMMSKTSGDRRIVVATADPNLAAGVKKRLENPPTGLTQSARGNQADLSDVHFHVQPSSDLSETAKHALEAQIDRKAIDGFLWLDPPSLAEHKFSYTATSTTDFIEIQRIKGAVRDAAVTRDLELSGVTEDKLSAAMKPYAMDAVHWSQGQAKHGGDLQFLTVFILGFAMYMITLMYGMNVLRAVITEKSSRIMEVLLSTLTPEELLSGKIFGVAAVGLTQVSIWMTAAVLASAPAAFTFAGMIRQANFTPVTGIFFAVYFLLGFFLYSSLCAALGSTVNSEQEAQQFQFVVMIPLMLSFFYVFFAVRAPNDPLVVALSMFPFSAPLVMYARIVLGAAPPWQIAVSLAGLVLTIAIVIWLCARIYRVGVLMYGKKPTLPEIIRWLRYA